MSDLRVLMTGLVIPESARWHEGRLWFSAWGDRQILALDADGKSEVMGEGTTDFGYCIDWLPDGRLLSTGTGLWRTEPDGTVVPHADLSGLPGSGWNEIVVDGRGYVYINSVGFDFGGGEQFRPGYIAVVTPDGDVRQVADGIAFPNGMVVTADNRTLVVAESFTSRLTAFDIGEDGGLSNRRVWAELGQGGDGICMDAEGAIWTPITDDGRGACVRVREGGEIVDRVDVDQFCFACTLGGDDGRTLFLMEADWRGVEHLGDQARTGRVLSTQVPVPR